MYIALLLVATLLLSWLMTRDSPKKPFDWTRRRPWWRPRWLFPDGR